jgi:hypothetical protein
MRQKELLNSCRNRTQRNATIANSQNPTLTSSHLHKNRTVPGPTPSIDTRSNKPYVYWPDDSECAHSNIAKEAEAHCCISLCMPRWSHNCSSCFQLPLCYLISNLQKGVVHRAVGTYLHMNKLIFRAIFPTSKTV